MGNEKDFDSRVQSIENMVVVMAFLVRKRSALWEGWVSSYASLGVNLKLDSQVSFRSAKKSQRTIIRMRSLIAVEVNGILGTIKEMFSK